MMLLDFVKCVLYKTELEKLQLLQYDMPASHEAVWSPIWHHVPYIPEDTGQSGLAQRIISTVTACANIYPTENYRVQRHCKYRYMLL